jgi:2-dehydro-3-deoxy-D-arabinonate dehydratase
LGREIFGLEIVRAIKFMKLCRFQVDQKPARVGLWSEDGVILDLSSAGVKTLTELLERHDCLERVMRLTESNLPRLALSDIRLLAPVEQQEIWAAGVTYQRSKKARMEESDFSATAYDRVYEAERPELFFKSLPEKVVAPGEPIGIRSDARWNVPEPELALVVNSRAIVAGYTIGNDVSSRDIEGENLLYLPQAKIYQGSCALGPSVVVGASEGQARSWKIQLRVTRDRVIVFQGETSIDQIRRSFDDLVRFLFRSQVFRQGAVLLTGTGIVPPDHFSLEADDAVEISISGIGSLQNPVVRV